MNDYPILVFPKYVEASRAKRSSGFEKIRFPKPIYNWRRLGPKFTELYETLERRKMHIQQGAEGVNPEDVLVLETAGRIEDFYNAVKNVEGLEWLFEEDIEGKPDEEFCVLDNEGTPTSKSLSSRLYLISTNTKSLSELKSLFELYANNPQVKLPQGYGKFKNVFEQLRTIRFWNYNDRLDGNDFFEQWLRNNEAFPDMSIKFQIELWYRGSENKRKEAQEKTAKLVEACGGKVLSSCVIKEIRYHAMLVELPGGVLRQMIDEMAEGSLISSQDIMFFKALPQMAKITISDVESFPKEAWEKSPKPTGEPVVALLDGYPLQHHSTLDDRIVIDDPYDFENLYNRANQRIHGTGMASLIIHGDLSSASDALDSKLYVSPIMYPDNNGEEQLPEDMLIVDLIHRTVKRMFEGEKNVKPTAPNVKIINFSIGDPVRVFHGTMSPMARLLDWLSYKYSVLFVISAGNVNDQTVPTGCHFDEFKVKGQEDISKTVTTTLLSKRIEHKIISPAESINNLTVGSTHKDGSTIPAYPERINPYDCNHPAIYSPFGGGLRNSIKPDLVFDGGRQVLYERLYGQKELHPDCHSTAPGLKVASPNSNLDSTVFTRGTSCSAALVSRNAYFCYKRLCEILSGYEASESHIHLMIKAMAVHGCYWDELGDNIEKTLPVVKDVKSVKRQWIGYGYPDFQKAIECNPHRVTVMGFAELKSEEAHVYSFPLPPAISKGRKKRRMTVTLAWMSPIASENQKYRKARMWVKLNDNDNLFKRIGSKIDVADTMAAQRGTLQHEVFEGESHFPFEDGTMLEFKVNCADDAGGFKEPIKYALAVTLEVTEPITSALFPELEESNIYQEVKDRLKIKEAVSIRQNM